MNFNEQNLLKDYGWNEQWESEWNNRTAGSGDGSATTADLTIQPARVTAQFSHAYKIMTQTGERLAKVTGKYEYTAAHKSDFPAVGDWVAAESSDDGHAMIHSLLSRRSAMTRRAAGNRTEAQVIGANIDVLFIVNALNDDFNLRKIERYLVMAWESGASPVVLLTKSDLCADWETKRFQVEEVAPGVPVHAVSAVTDQGKDLLAPFLIPGRTVAVTGSSGAGKSTLLNWLAEEELQLVQGIREDDARGRHTTTHRELFRLPGGALLMDTPGMRELQLWEASDGWQEAFSDIGELAGQCRFRDCSHGKEAGCAVRSAIQSGELDAKRYANYQKTERELARLARKEQSAAGRNRRNARDKQGQSAKQERTLQKAAFYDPDPD